MEAFITMDQLSAVARRELEGDLAAEMALTQACELVRDFLNVDLEAVVDDVGILDADGSQNLVLPHIPVVGVSSVYIRGRTDDTNVLVPTTDYWIDFRKGMLVTRMRGAIWLTGRGMYQVTYSHGWDNPATSGGSGSGGSGSGSGLVFPALPQGLISVALALALRIFDQGLAKQETIGQYVLEYAADSANSFTMGERSMLTKFRNSIAR